MMMRHKLLVAALSAAIGIASTSVSAKDGTYEASVLGRNGDVKVQVVITGDKIASVKVLDWSETHPIADLPGEKIPADMVKYQTVNVDVISGATLTAAALSSAFSGIKPRGACGSTLFIPRALDIGKVLKINEPHPSGRLKLA